MTLLLLFGFLLSACGGGGGGGTPGAKLSGRLLLSSGTAIPQRALAEDLEPNGTLARARWLASASAQGHLDARADRVDAYRVVVLAAGVYRPVVTSEGVKVLALLYDLERNRAGAALRVDAGAVLDVILLARSGAGGYRFHLVSGGEESGVRTPPDGYLPEEEAQAAGEIVARPAEGVTDSALASVSGLKVARRGARACLFRLGGKPGLRLLLARCARLRAQGIVRWAEPNYRRRLARAPDDPLFSGQWALAQIRAPAAWDRSTGPGALVAVIDSGIRAGHPDLAGRLVSGYDFVDSDADPNDPTPGFSHGTETAGIVAASGNNGTGVSGILWNGRVMPLRAFDTAGFGTSFDIAQAIRYAVGLANASGLLPAEPARVINLSFASAIPTQVEEDACNAARAAGAVLIGAAGNNGTSTTQYPAGYASVLAVAATDASGAVASYSSFGNWIDLAAPGGTTASGVRTTGILTGGSFGYPSVSGTSFAAPQVAGVAALVLGAGSRTAAEVEQILLSTAQDIGAPGVDPRSGHGIVDAFRALLAGLGETPPVLGQGEIVEVRLLSWPSGAEVFSVQTTLADGLVWAFADVPAGKYRIEAGTDRNFDGTITGPGEVWGRWSDATGNQVLEVLGSGPVAGLDFTIQPG